MDVGFSEMGFALLLMAAVSLGVVLFWPTSKAGGVEPPAVRKARRVPSSRYLERRERPSTLVMSYLDTEALRGLSHALEGRDGLGPRFLRKLDSHPRSSALSAAELRGMSRTLHRALRETAATDADAVERLRALQHSTLHAMHASWARGAAEIAVAASHAAGFALSPRALHVHLRGCADGGRVEAAMSCVRGAVELGATVSVDDFNLAVEALVVGNAPKRIAEVLALMEAEQQSIGGPNGATVRLVTLGCCALVGAQLASTASKAASGGGKEKVRGADLAPAAAAIATKHREERKLAPRSSRASEAEAEDDDTWLVADRHGGARGNRSRPTAAQQKADRAAAEAAAAERSRAHRIASAHHAAAKQQQMQQQMQTQAQTRLLAARAAKRSKVPPPAQQLQPQPPPLLTAVAPGASEHWLGLSMRMSNVTIVLDGEYVRVPEVMISQPNFKTALCRHFPGCTFGAKCHFAHGVEQQERFKTMRLALRAQLPEQPRFTPPQRPQPPQQLLQPSPLLQPQPQPQPQHSLPLPLSLPEGFSKQQRAMLASSPPTSPPLFAATAPQPAAPPALQQQRELAQRRAAPGSLPSAAMRSHALSSTLQMMNPGGSPDFMNPAAPAFRPTFFEPDAAALSAPGARPGQQGDASAVPQWFGELSSLPADNHAHSTLSPVGSRRTRGMASQGGARGASGLALEQEFSPSLAPAAAPWNISMDGYPGSSAAPPALFALDAGSASSPVELERAGGAATASMDDPLGSLPRVRSREDFVPMDLSFLTEE